MPIERDLSGLPGPGKVSDSGWAPDKEPRFVQVLAEKWMADDLEQGPRPRAVPDARFRFSDAGKCARAVGYAAIGLPDSNPMDLTGHYVTQLGTKIHDEASAALKSRFGMEAEVVCIIDGFEGSGHADGELTRRGLPEDSGPPHRVVYELKTVGGYAYKMAVGERGAPQGPSWSYVVQGALNAVARNADELVVGLLARDVISVQAAARKGFGEILRFGAEWTLTREQFEPIAAEEMARVRGILGLVDEGTLPARKIPGLPPGHVITDPSNGTWVVTQDGAATDAGSAWNCSYCRWQQLCSLTSAQRAPIMEVDVALNYLGLPARRLVDPVHGTDGSTNTR